MSAFPGLFRGALPTHWLGVGRPRSPEGFSPRVSLPFCPEQVLPVPVGQHPGEGQLRQGSLALGDGARPRSFQRSVPGAALGGLVWKQLPHVLRQELPGGVRFGYVNRRFESLDQFAGVAFWLPIFRPTAIWVSSLRLGTLFVLV